MAAATDSNEIMNAGDLADFTEDKALERLREKLAKRGAQEKEAKDLKAIFMEQDVRPDAAQRVMNVVRKAAEGGQRQVLAFRFPASYCNDGGRAINNFEPGWPESLEGYARRAYLWYAEHLQPKGYRLRAEILNFPDGMPGDVGIYLRW